MYGISTSSSRLSPQSVLQHCSFLFLICFLSLSQETAHAANVGPSSTTATALPTSEEISAREEPAHAGIQDASTEPSSPTPGDKDNEHTTDSCQTDAVDPEESPGVELVQVKQEEDEPASVEASSKRLKKSKNKDNKVKKRSRTPPRQSTATSSRRSRDRSRHRSRHRSRDRTRSRHRSRRRSRRSYASRSSAYRSRRRRSRRTMSSSDDDKSRALSQRVMRMLWSQLGKDMGL